MTLEEYWPPVEVDDRAIVSEPRKCRRHQWRDGLCLRCPAVKDEARSRRNKNNGKRGRSDELTVAKLIGGRKVGPLGLPWDVEIPGYLRLQAKKLGAWPSINEVIRWLDAMPAGNELRGVTLADTPGAGTPTRRLLIVDLGDFARWHGGNS